MTGTEPFTAQHNHQASSAAFFFVVRRRLGAAGVSPGDELSFGLSFVGVTALFTGAIGPSRKRCHTSSSGLARPCRASSMVKSAIVRTTQSK